MADEKRLWKGGQIERSHVPDMDMEKIINDSRRRSIRKKIIKGYLTDSIDCVKEVLKTNVDKIEKIVSEMVRAYYEDRQVITMGNGGSASIASHMASDFSKAWLGDGLMRMRSISLVDSIPLMTAWMNDAGYNQMFVGPLKTILNDGDIVIGISSSGNSKNVINAIKYANRKKAFTIGLTGFDGGDLKDIAKISIVVKSNSFKRVEDMHALIGHAVKSALINEIKKSKAKL